MTRNRIQANQYEGEVEFATHRSGPAAREGQDLLHLIRECRYLP